MTLYELGGSVNVFRVAVIIALALLVIQAARGEVAQRRFTAAVSYVIDGDTIIVHHAGKRQWIRLYGIDAPENNQPYGAEATAYLRRALAGGMVTVHVVDIDHYGRLIGRLYVDDRYLNLELVEHGLAWHYERFSGSRDLAAAQRRARRLRVGLWQDRTPAAPWEWRN